MLGGKDLSQDFRDSAKVGLGLGCIFFFSSCIWHLRAFFFWPGLVLLLVILYSFDKEFMYVYVF